jgi:predicted neuraminidase
VLFQPKQGPLMLLYKVGPSPDTWWGMLTTSADGGKTWDAPRRLPDGILGPIKDKPILLPDGTILCGSSTEHDGWRVHMERTSDLGKTWTKTGALNDGRTVGAIQPTILWHDAAKQKLQILARCRTGGRILTAWSEDGGKTWGGLSPIAALPNPNSGIDATTLADGRHLLVYNHTPRGRSPLNVAVSEDGRTWKAGPVLESEPGEFSYPAVIQADDGMVHITYTWKRQRIRHVVIDPRKMALRDLPAGEPAPAN